MWGSEPLGSGMFAPFAGGEVKFFYKQCGEVGAFLETGGVGYVVDGHIRVIA